MSVARTRTLLPATALAILWSIALAVQPELQLHGGLELVWGDSAPDAATHEFEFPLQLRSRLGGERGAAKRRRCHCRQ